MSSESHFTASLMRSFNTIFDIHYTIAKFHVKHGLSVKIDRSWEGKVFVVKCSDEE